MPILLLASQAGALGLGEIRLSSALNEPLRAEIELLAVAPDDLINLTIQMASSETFNRYDLDRPAFLSSIEFEIVSSGGADGNIIRVASTAPISEPFVTFLVEASWSRGRLLREYTLLLDPPTFATAPANRATQTVTAPTRASPTNSGQIQRPVPQPAPGTTPAVQAPVSAPTQAATQDDRTRDDSPAPAPVPAAEDSTQGQPEFDATPGGDLVVQRGDTLWGITSRNRPDSRLTMNQTMLAIYEANPHAFEGNINVMRAGVSLRIPSADDVFRIARGEALAEVQRHNADWGSDQGIASVDTQPLLELVPPDEEEDIGLIEDFTDTSISEIQDDVQAVEAVVDPTERRILELEGILEDQDSLIEIPANELAALRAELAALRGEELLVEEELADTTDDELMVDDENIVDDQAAEDTTQEEAAPPVVAVPPKEDSFLDTLMGLLNNIFVWIAAALVITMLILFWFMRRAAGRDDDEATGVWDALDADEADAGSVESVGTETLMALSREDDSIVVVETTPVSDSDDSMFLGDTMEVPVDVEPPTPIDSVEPSSEFQDQAETPDTVETPAPVEIPGETDTSRTLEDTFSSETAINLDQSDPVAEADFHMAYGLYDQAADLINGVLVSDPERQDLLAKLCEIYFVWGNRDGFIDAAGRLKTAIGSGENPDWDKTVIMGQQIAGEHAMFSGVSAEGATRAVDLSFDDADDAGALDIDFADSPDSAADEVVDLGADPGDSGSTSDTGQVSISPDAGSAIDFSLDDPDVEASVTQEMPASPTDTGTINSPLSDDTAEMPMPEPGADATAEIEIADLGLDLGDLDAAVLGGDIGEDDQISDLEDTAESKTLEMIDSLAETGKGPALDFEVESGQTGVTEGLDIAQALAATSEVEALDEGTGILPGLSELEATELAPMDTGEDTDVGIDTSLLEATGQTQVLQEDETVEVPGSLSADLSDDDATMLAPAYVDDDTVETAVDSAETIHAPLQDDADDGEFDFAKTEALPKDAFDSDPSASETGMMPELPGSTDMDLDLDDLTAALKVSDVADVGDTISRAAEEATVEQPRIKPEDAGSTQEMMPGDLSGDLNDARTMTEVGTKLDLARAYVDMGDPGGAKSILEEVLDEGDDAQKQQARKFLDSLPK